MTFEWNPLMDWNAVVHALDTLSEGTHSFLELSYMVEHYDRASVTQGLLFLADRELIELSSGWGPSEPILKAEWSQRLTDAFGSDATESSIMTSTSIDLTKKGEQILLLFGIGHP